MKDYLAASALLISVLTFAVSWGRHQQIVKECKDELKDVLSTMLTSEDCSKNQKSCRGMVDLKLNAKDTDISRVLLEMASMRNDIKSLVDSSHRMELTLAREGVRHRVGDVQI